MKFFLIGVFALSSLMSYAEAAETNQRLLKPALDRKIANASVVIGNPDKPELKSKRRRDREQAERQAEFDRIHSGCTNCGGYVVP